MGRLHGDERDRVWKKLSKVSCGHDGPAALVGRFSPAKSSSGNSDQGIHWLYVPAVGVGIASLPGHCKSTVRVLRAHPAPAGTRGGVPKGPVQNEAVLAGSRSAPATLRHATPCHGESAERLHGEFQPPTGTDRHSWGSAASEAALGVMLAGVFN